MSYKEILDNVSNIENLDNVTILKTLQKFSRAIRDFAEKQTGIENLLNVEFIPNDNAITYGDGVVDYLGNLKLTLDDNIIVNKPCTIKLNIKGSETIVVDVDEFDNALEIHLDSEFVNKIERALLLPLSSPSEDMFVLVGVNNSQKLEPVSTILKGQIKYEDIYNKDSEDVDINLGMTSGLPFGTSNVATLVKNRNNFDILKITAQVNSSNRTIIFFTENQNSVRAGFVTKADWLSGNSICYGNILITNNTIDTQSCWAYDFDDNSNPNYSQNSNFIITKIEGGKKL